MIFDGIKFRHAPKVVAWRTDDGCDFGRIVKPGVKGAALRLCVGGRTLWTKPVKQTGRSRTNMVYGSDGKVYLCLDACCYTAR